MEKRYWVIYRTNQVLATTKEMPAPWQEVTKEEWEKQYDIAYEIATNTIWHC